MDKSFYNRHRTLTSKVLENWCPWRYAGLTERFAREIEAVKTQYPFEEGLGGPAR